MCGCSTSARYANITEKRKCICFMLLFYYYDNLVYEFDSVELSEFYGGNLQNKFLQLKKP